KGMRIAEVLTAPRSPWQNPFAERVIGTIRRELLDHVIVLSEGHVRRRLHNYLRYYHGSRMNLKRQPSLEVYWRSAPEPLLNVTETRLFCVTGALPGQVTVVVSLPAQEPSQFERSLPLPPHDAEQKQSADDLFKVVLDPFRPYLLRPL